MFELDILTNLKIRYQTFQLADGTLFFQLRKKVSEQANKQISDDVMKCIDKKLCIFLFQQLQNICSILPQTIKDK